MKVKPFVSLRWQFLFNTVASLIISFCLALIVNGFIRSQKKDFEEEIKVFQQEANVLLQELKSYPSSSIQFKQLLDSNPNYNIYFLDEEGKVLYASSNRFEKQFDLVQLKENVTTQMNSTYEVMYYYLIAHDDGQYILITTKIIASDSKVYLFVFVTVFFGLFFLLTYRHMKYIEVLDCLLNEITTEHLEVCIPIRGNDELTRIARSIQKMSQKLYKQHQMDEFLKKSKDEFVLNISHDLRTPLTSMMGYLDLIHSGYVQDDEAYTKYIEIIHKQTHRLDTLVNELFEYNSLKMGANTLNKVRVCLNELLFQVSESFLLKCEEKNLSLVIKCPKEEVIINIDVNKMLRVFENIIINAIRYSPHDAKICITLNKVSEEEMNITFENEGEKLSEDTLLHLFDSYYRGEMNEENASKGAGLGLAIAQEIVLLHQGQLVVFNTEQGVCFKLTLY